MKFLLLRWIRSIFRTTSTSQLSISDIMRWYAGLSDVPSAEPFIDVLIGQSPASRLAVCVQSLELSGNAETLLRLVVGGDPGVDCRAHFVSHPLFVC